MMKMMIISLIGIKELELMRILDLIELIFGLRFFNFDQRLVLVSREN